MRWLATIVQGVHRLLFCDPVRPIEVFSALNFLAWAHLLWTHPEVLSRDSYAGFQYLGATFWCVVLTLTAFGQLVPVAYVFRHSANLRFLSMAGASGAWLMIALNFIGSGVSSTADANYLLLSLICMVSGAWLGWTSRSL